MTWNQFKVLMIGVTPLVRDNVRVLLGTLGCGCVLGSSLKDAPALLQKERPAAAILEQQLLNSTPAEVLATFHKLFFKLQGRTVLLTREDSDPQTLRILDAYAMPKVSVDLMFQELWPCLESLLRGDIAPIKRDARLIFDSFLQPLPAGIRSIPVDRTLLYEAADVMIDLWLEPQGDSGHTRIMGQVVGPAQTAPQNPCYPVVVQAKTEPIAAATSNEMGEFQLDCELHRHMKLEIGVRERQWVSLELPEFSRSTQEIQD